MMRCWNARDRHEYALQFSPFAAAVRWFYVPGALIPKEQPHEAQEGTTAIRLNAEKVEPPTTQDWYELGWAVAYEQAAIACIRQTDVPLEYGWQALFPPYRYDAVWYMSGSAREHLMAQGLMGLHAETLMGYPIKQTTGEHHKIILGNMARAVVAVADFEQYTHEHICFGMQTYHEQAAVLWATD